MKDWCAIARASGFKIPAEELPRVVFTLETLDAAFRPLAERLTPEMEPALLFRAEEESE
jgi:hypothetical protein